MKLCHDCATAQVMPWRVYRDDCPECQIRCIANMPSDRRDPVYERIEAECGRSALETIKQKVGLEILRLKRMRGDH